MEGASPKVCHTATEQVSDAFHHFASRLVGEGQQEDAVSRDAVLDEPGDAVGQGARLAGTRTGEDQAGPRGRGDCLILLGVEFLRVVDPQVSRRTEGVQLVLTRHPLMKGAHAQNPNAEMTGIQPNRSGCG